MLRYVLLGSGSNGNCCIIESNNTVIAIDFGLTMKEIKERADKQSSRIHFKHTF